jgi:predicted transcriptional regulator of viral defense system
VTDLERTLLDGLEKPRYCMGIREVLSAFELARNRINIDKICNYAISHGSIALQKRLGFVLEKLDLDPAVIDKLKAIPVRVYQKLDILGGRAGKYHKVHIPMNSNKGSDLIRTTNPT